jgi:hypothetical protein
MSDKVYDYTMLDTFQTCRKKYYYSFVRGLDSKRKSSALSFGTAIHSALDTYYFENDISKAITKFRETFTSQEDEVLRNVDNGVKLLENYPKVYPTEIFKVLGKPEKGFVLPIGDILYGGRIDLPIEIDGQVWVMEHKTTSRITGSYFDQFDLDKQITGYILGTEEFTGRTCVGCMINVLEPWKELIKPTAKSKGVQDHYLRCPKTRTPYAKERFRLNVQRIVRDIEWCEKNDEWYEAEKKDVCFHYNYNCPFKTLCQFGEDEQFIKNEFNVREWKPYEVEKGSEIE